MCRLWNTENMQETSVSVQKNVYLALRPIFLVLGITKDASSSSSSSSAPTLLAVLNRAVPGAEGVVSAAAPGGCAGGGRGAPCPLTAGGPGRAIPTAVASTDAAAAAAAAAAGRWPRACVERCRTCGRVLGASRTASANPARERRDQGRRRRRGQILHRDSPPSSMRSWTCRYMHGPQAGTGRAPACAENRARKHTHHRGAAAARRAAHRLLARARVYCAS
jgi:hypothetical protein